jgi:hypothetical protein
METGGLQKKRAPAGARVSGYGRLQERPGGSSATRRVWTRRLLPETIFAPVARVAPQHASE